MEFFAFTKIIAAILTLMLATLLILNRQFNRLNVSFILIMLNEALASIIGYYTNTNDIETFLILLHITFVLNGFSFITILYYVLILSGYIDQKHKKILGIKVQDFIVIAVAAFVIIEFVLNFTDILVKDLIIHTDGSYELIWSNWMFIPQAFSIISIAYVFLMMFNALKKSEKGSRRTFLKLNIAGTMILFGTGPIIGILLPILGFNTGVLVEYGTVFASFIYFYGITKYQYDTIHDLNISLEQKVEDRTRHLRETQARLVQSEKMAALNKLVAGIAHELNTPIGALTSAQDTLKRAAQKIDDLLADNEDKQLKNSLKVVKSTTDVVVEGSERVANIVRRMKSFSQLDEADLQTVDIHDGIRDTLAVFTPELKNGITVKEDFGDVPLVTCYPARLNQLILFLLDNANRAIEDSGEIQIRTRLRDSNIEIIVKDDGIGIPEANLGKIFDPGFTTWGVGVGVGLGLSIAYQIVEEHKGKIIVNSSEGNGTEVVIHLPVG